MTAISAGPLRCRNWSCTLGEAFFLYNYCAGHDVGVIPYSRIYRMSQEECARLREGVPYVKVYRYNPKHLCPKLTGYGDNGQRSLKL